MKPLALYDASDAINCITWPKSCVVPHFNHLDLRNTIIPFMMPSAPCDSDASASGLP